LIDFYTAWHLLFASWIYIFIHNQLGHGYAWVITMSIAIVYEISEVFWNLNSYSTVNRFLKNSFFDIVVALISCAVCTIILTI
jgi:hypothetical protein